MINSDIYIMIPVGGKIKDSIFKGLEKRSDIDNYVETLTETSKYECDIKVSSSLSRINYGKTKISYYESDDYDDLNNIVEWIDCDIVYTFNETTSLGIIQLIITNCAKEDSQVGDIISSNHLSIKVNEDEYCLGKFLDKLSLRQYGKIRTINCNDVNKKDHTLKNTLIAEAANSDVNPYPISNIYSDRIGNENLAKYSFYELYADEKTVVYLLKDFYNNYKDNIESESLITFICEIAIFQNAAVSRINAQIIDELIENSNIKSQKSLDLQVEYGKTILFWNNNVFNYHAAQDLSNDIVNAFKTKDLMQEYEKNSNHLSQIANLKSGITASIEARVLNALAFILSISQLVELFKNIKNVIAGKEWQVGIFSSSFILLIVIIIIYRNNYINKKK